MNENRFWALIEEAWNSVGGFARLRQDLVEGFYSENRAYTLCGSMTPFLVSLRKQLEKLSAGELREFDRILERKLYDIDREDIHLNTDGSDDGFLYCRGFIVAIGQAYYETVKDNPKRAVLDAECEGICYISLHLYEERFGEMPQTGISRESGSNPAGCPGGS